MSKKPIEIRCSACEKGTFRERRVDQDLSGVIGLEGVMVKDAPALVCSNCGEVMVTGAVLERVSVVLAARILERSELAPAEVRYLRKMLLDRQEDLADRLGVTRATVNRWETGTDLVTGPAAYAVRSHAFFRLRARSPLIEAVAPSFETRTLAKKKTQYVFHGRDLRAVAPV